MPTETDRSARIGLALSGGGFRATLYHCGALIRLNELGYLAKLDRITSVSGGSITSARLAARWEQLDFDANGVAQGLLREVVDPLREFCRQTLDLKVIGLGLIPFTKSGTERLINAYDTQLLDGLRLDQLPTQPDFVFQSTNLQTGRSLRFERSRVADFTVGEIKDTSKFSVAQAVAASSAFPPVLSPVKISVKADDWADMEGTTFFYNNRYKRDLNLTDGGVYDNLGLNRIESFGTILCSDAGKPFNYGSTFASLAPRQVLRALNIAMDQTRALRTRNLIKIAQFQNQKIGFWDIDGKDVGTPTVGEIPWSPKVAAKIASLPTQLRPFLLRDEKRLINWGYTCCNEVISQHVDPAAPPAPGLPHPKTPLE